MAATFSSLFSSQARYWLLLLVILALNILLIVYYNPSNETVCPIAFNFHPSENESIINDGFSNEYVVSTYVLGSLFAFLTVWMLLEYYIVNLPHFVPPRILYTCSDKMEKYKLLRIPGR